MYKNKLKGRNNIVGLNVRRLRFSQNPQLSQNDVASRLQSVGFLIEKNEISKMENGSRFVTDLEILALSEIFKVSPLELLNVDKAKEFQEKNPISEKSVADGTFASENLPHYVKSHRQ